MTKDMTEASHQKVKKLSSGSLSHRINNSNYYKCFQNYYHAHRYLKPNPLYYTDIKVNVNHWQLRDLILADQKSGNIYYTKDDSIYSFDRNQLKSELHLNLEFAPRCFSQTKNGCTIAGGVLTSVSKALSSNIDSLTSRYKSTRPAKGLFSFYNPATSYSGTYKLGEMINNSVMLYDKLDGNFKAHVCNNDSSLYSVDIQNNGKFTIDNQVSCELNTSLNNSMTNPMNEKVTAVSGDSSSIFLLDTTIQKAKIQTIKTKHESGFGLSYHPNGHLLSAAFQDGTCLLFDLRKIEDFKPLLEIKSTRPGHQSGAFRCCKFSNSALNDMLVILEHVGRVHIIDLRNLNESNVNDHQVIVFPFALDQFGDYMKDASNRERNPGSSKLDLHTMDVDMSDASENDHLTLNIYGDTNGSTNKNHQNLQFTAPLVYDYDYLHDINPKLFRNFIYQAPQETTLSEHLPPPEFNYPQWNGSSNYYDCNNEISPTSSQRPSIDANFDPHSSVE